MDRLIAPGWEADQCIEARYRLLRLINRGGMADVFEAEDERLQRRVAIKRFRADPVADRSRFDSEVTLLASLEHPNLVRVFDAGEHDGDAFLVLELVEGPTVAERMTSGPLPTHEVATLGRDVAGALAYVHERGVVHRDVTPANILCGDDGRPRLADFGIARVLDATRLTSTALTVGTAAYMAPEQVQGGDVTGCADVYALGLLLVEMLSGQRAFDGSMHEVAIARLVRAPDVTSAPEAWRELLSAMTERAPEDRPTAAEAAARLDALAHEAQEDLTGLTPVVVAGAAGTGAAVGDDARTQLMEQASGGTSVMPAVLAPAPDQELEPSPAATAVGSFAAAVWARRALLVVGGVVLLLVVLLAMVAGGDGVDVPSPSTEPVSAEPPTTVAPTTTSPPTTEAPPANGRGEGRGKGKKGDD